jgi:hypothetical protein
MKLVYSAVKGSLSIIFFSVLLHRPFGSGLLRLQVEKLALILNQCLNIGCLRKKIKIKCFNLCCPVDYLENL